MNLLRGRSTPLGWWVASLLVAFTFYAWSLYAWREAADVRAADQAAALYRDCMTSRTRGIDNHDQQEQFLAVVSAQENTLAVALSVFADPTDQRLTTIQAAFAAAHDLRRDLQADVDSFTPRECPKP